MGLFTNKDDERSLEDLNQQLEQKERERLKLEGEQRFQALKDRKRQELRQKQKEVKKRQFKQSKAGKVLSFFGEELDRIAENTGSQRAAQLSNTAEAVDGDGKGDTRASFGVGKTRKRQAKKDLQVAGDLEVEGDIIEQGERRTKQQENNQPSIFDEDFGKTLL